MSRSTIPEKESRLLYTQSGNICAFPGCNAPLTEPPTDTDAGVNVTDVCHIVADSRHGPRGHSDLTDEERQRHTNLILFCPQHHRIVDAQPRTYSVPVLQKIKHDHETRVRRQLRPSSEKSDGPPLVIEKVHSTVLAITHLPATVYSAPCKITDDPGLVARQIIYPDDRGLLTPFILRDGKLSTFVNITRRDNPFRELANSQQATAEPTETFWGSDEGGRRFTNLLNQALSRYLRGQGIGFDKEHHRYFFGMEVEGESRTHRYRPLNAGERDAKVVFPANRRSGEFKGFWWHEAVALRFEKVGPKSFYLSIRPERHLTTNGLVPLPAEKIGRRVTRLKARMYNDKYIAETQFWRDVLCDGKPRLIASFGEQSMVIDSQLIQFSITWPGIPDDEKDFKNQTYDDDLFSLAGFDAAVAGGHLDEEDEIDEEDDHADE